MALQREARLLITRGCCTLGTAVAAAGLVAWLAARAGWPLARYYVADASMQPTLAPGDRLLAVRWGRWRTGRDRLPTGAIVVARDPTQPGRFLVKRVAGYTPAAGERPAAYLLHGDNAPASRDSRAFGPVPAHLIEGRAVWRYLPPHRRSTL